MYPDQSLYPANSVPNVVRRINQALQRSDQIQTAEGQGDTYWFAPIVADAEAGFGGPLNVFELMKSMIEAGAGGVHFEDQLASEKKCGHMGGKVLIPTKSAIKHLVSARLAADVMGVSTLIIARTDANGAHLITSDIDPVDHTFLTSERTPEGFYKMRGGLNAAIARRAFLRAVLRPHLVRNFLSQICTRRSVLPMPSMNASQVRCWRTLLALVQLGEKAGCRNHRNFPV